jgi:helix-turn-helix protein
MKRVISSTVRLESMYNDVVDVVVLCYALIVAARRVLVVIDMCGRKRVSEELKPYIARRSTVA